MRKGQPPGVFNEVIVLPWNDLEAIQRTIKQHGNNIAAVIMEPVMCNNGCVRPKPGYLEGVRALCDEARILLIFDEIITGFRCSLGGAQAIFKVTPDLATFGKAIANGFPISVLAGRAKYMDLIGRGEVMHAGTFNSYNAGVAAAIATIEALRRDRAAAMRRISRIGKKLMNGIRRIARACRQEDLLIQGIGPMFHVGFTRKKEVFDYEGTLSYDKKRYVRLVIAMRKRGIRLIGRGIWYVCAAHTDEDVDYALNAFAQSLDEITSPGSRYGLHALLHCHTHPHHQGFLGYSSATTKSAGSVSHWCPSTPAPYISPRISIPAPAAIKQQYGESCFGKRQL